MSYSDPSRKPASGTSHYNESDPRNVNPKQADREIRLSAPDLETAQAYGRSARGKHGDKDAKFESVAQQLADEWNAKHASSGIAWEQARAAVEAAWNRGDEKTADRIAGEAGFDNPPTFTEQGRDTPRNIDEPNS